MLEKWNELSLGKQFLSAGVAVAVFAMALVGYLVADMIERAFIKHAASATALYVDSVVAPILPDMRTTRRIDGIVSQSLDETLSAGKLGERLVSFRLWRGDGTILYSNRPELTGKRFPPSESLKRAFAGEVVAEYGEPDDQESDIEKSLGVPLLEIYSPVLQPWTGEVVAVSEFYESVPDLAQGLWAARIRGWGAVALVTLGLFLTLAAIVLRGSSTIEAQRVALKQRVDDLEQLAATNKALAINVQDASQRATAFNERFLRRLGADLHDGPAQLIAFAALRLGSKMFRDEGSARKPRDAEIGVIRASLAEAMEEIRMISSGLAIPHIDTAAMKEVIAAAVRPHAQRSGAEIKIDTSSAAPILNNDAKICVFRFVQEALTNAVRHGGPDCSINVNQRFDGHLLIIEVSDDGPGFDVEAVGGDRLGLGCLRQRVESVGGTLDIASSRRGTTLTMTLQAAEFERPKWAA
jgi:signal transduction histidine kinase